MAGEINVSYERCVAMIYEVEQTCTTLNLCMEIAESGQTLVMERARAQPDVYTRVRKSGKVAVVYSAEIAIGNNLKQTRMRSFLADPATEIRLITYRWMLELSPLVRPHNV